MKKICTPEKKFHGHCRAAPRQEEPYSVHRRRVLRRLVQAAELLPLVVLLARVANKREYNKIKGGVVPMVSTALKH